MSIAEETVALFKQLPAEKKAEVLETLRNDCQLAMSHDLMTDKEMAAMLRVSLNTLRNHIKHGPPKKCGRTCADIRKIKTVSIGAKRFWPLAAVKAFIEA